MDFGEHLRALSTYNQEDPYVNLYKNLLLLTHFQGLDEKTPYSPELLIQTLGAAVEALRNMPDNGAYTSLRTDLATLIAEHLEIYRMVLTQLEEVNRSQASLIRQEAEARAAPLDSQAEVYRQLIESLSEIQVS